MIDDPPSDTPAAYRNKEDEELYEALGSGPITNLHVQCALAEIHLRSGERQERWSKKAYVAAIVAAAAAVIGAIGAWAAIVK
jgi:hypothetical protein